MLKLWYSCDQNNLELTSLTELCDHAWQLVEITGEAALISQRLETVRLNEKSVLNPYDKFWHLVQPAVFPEEFRRKTITNKKTQNKPNRITPAFRVVLTAIRSPTFWVALTPIVGMIGLIINIINNNRSQSPNNQQNNSMPPPSTIQPPNTKSDKTPISAPSTIQPPNTKSDKTPISDPSTTQPPNHKSNKTPISSPSTSSHP